MAMACEICMRTYNSEFFDGIDSDSSDFEFQQIISFGCLSSLLTWVKTKHQLLKSSRSLESSDVGIPSLSSIVHTVIRKIDTFGSSTTAPQPFYSLFPGPPRWAGARRELLDFMVQGKINRGTHTDHPAGRHSIRTNQCPPPPPPHIFYIWF